jgi:hypothetical protein
MNIFDIKFLEDDSIGQSIKGLVPLMKQVMLRQIYYSPEAMQDIKNWTIEEYINEQQPKRQ